MYLIFHLIVSLLHFLLCYIIFMLALLSNNIPILLILLILMMIIRFLFFLFGRCIVTLWEYNDHFSPIAELYSTTLTSNLDDKKAEEIIINLSILILLNKLLFLTLYNYYNKYKTII